MTDETTRLINDEQAPKEQPKVQNQNQTASDAATPTPAKSKKKGNAVAAGIGGFVAGAAVGAATTAAASPSEQELPGEVEEVKEVKDESIEAPEPDHAILANDEGIRYAHVDADNFNDAFAQAREQVGPGGVFEHNGKLYGTYTSEEWNDMSEQERSDFQSRVNEVAPSYHSTPSHSHVAETAVEHNEPAPEVVATNAEMIDVEPVDNEIRVLGVEAVQDGEGNIMNVALVECEGDQALLVDVDNNGSIDVLLHDDNADGQLQKTEIHDISGAGLEVADLMQAQAAQEGDILYASNDDMPDYVNDADSIMTV